MDTACTNTGQCNSGRVGVHTTVCYETWRQRAEAAEAAARVLPYAEGEYTRLQAELDAALAELHQSVAYAREPVQAKLDAALARVKHWEDLEAKRGHDCFNHTEELTKRITDLELLLCEAKDQHALARKGELDNLSYVLKLEARIAALEGALLGLLDCFTTATNNYVGTDRDVEHARAVLARKGE